MIYDVVIFSADGLNLSYGPLFVSSLLLKHNGLTCLPIQCIDKVYDEKDIQALVNKFVVDERQIVALSLTMVKSFQARAALKNVINLCIIKFPNIRFVLGGANYDDISEFEISENTSVLIGQNRENEIISLFFKLTGKLLNSHFNFTDFNVEYEKIIHFDPPNGFFGTLEISRGCRFNCAFCDFSLRQNQSQLKRKDLIVQELEQFYKVFKSNQIFIACHTFNESEEKITLMAEVCAELSFTPEFYVWTRLDLIVNQSELVFEFYRKYVAYVLFGIESFNSDSLRAIHKMPNIEKTKSFLKKYRELVPNSNITLALIIGLPHDSKEDFDEPLQWIEEEHIADNILVSPLRLADTSSLDPIYENEFSDISKNPEKYGYRILPDVKVGSLISSQEIVEHRLNYDTVELRHNWIRNDGYNYDMAILDSVVLSRRSTRTFAAPPLMALAMLSPENKYSLRKMKFATDGTQFSANDTMTEFERQLWSKISNNVQNYVKSLLNS